jgi:ABC-2 type transport system permease protein
MSATATAGPSGTLATAVRAEWVKATTTWVWWGLLLIALGLVSMNVGLFAALAPADAGAAETFPLPLVSTAEGQLAVVGGGFQAGYLIAAVLGALLATSDFRSGTIAPTFLAVPRRGRVAAAKTVVATVMGLLYGVTIQLASVAITAAVLAVRGIDLVGVDELARPLALGVLGITVWSLIGLAFGLLVRQQVLALVSLILVVFLLDPLAGFVLTGVGDVGGVDLEVVGSYLLTNASTALVEGFTGSQLLPWWGGLLVLLGWAAVLGVLGWRTTLRRDVA